MFFPPRYIIRVIKSILYVVLVCTLLLLFVYLLSEKNRDMTFTDLITKPIPLCVFFILFGIVYPSVSFIKKNVMLEKAYTEEKIKIIDIFETTGYELKSENGNILVFGLANSLSRITRLLGEDAIVLEYDPDMNCVSLSGYRKDVYRLAKHIKYADKQAEETN